MIPLFKPSFGQGEIDAVERVMKSGWWGLGPETEKFENEFAEYIGTKYAIATNSCTAALELALRCIGVGAGDSVITTPITFVSTAHAIEARRARVIFIDVFKETLNINPYLISEFITPRTKAIIPVHLYGVPCDMNLINRFAKKNNIKVVEDCAHACGSIYNKKRCGNLGDIGCFSFHAVKNLSCGDGGMITTNEKYIADKARKLRWLGINKTTHDRLLKRQFYGWEYWVEDLGYKCHMNDIASAIARVQLKKLEKNNKRRKEIAHKYIMELKDLPLILPNWDENSSWHIFAIRSYIRDELNIKLKEKGISTGVHYIPLINHPYYKDAGTKFYLPIAEREWLKLLSLPIFPDLTEKEQEYIIHSIRGILCQN